MTVSNSNALSRRQALSLIGAAGAGAAATGGLILPNATAIAQAAAGGSGLILPQGNVCVVTPETTEGPYYTDPKLVRADVTEGRPGVPTELQLQVVNAMCQPLANARVDIWHCDATGLYSNYTGQGDTGTTSTVGATFMRGTLMTNASGVATFKTVYPSWYRGRTTHIHFKVFLNTQNILTGQIFFPDTLSEYLYRNVAPYTSRASKRDTMNNTDGIAQQATNASFAYVKERSDSYLAAMIIGVNPNARSSGGLGGLPGFGPGGPGGPPPGGPGGPGGPPPGGPASGTGAPGGPFVPGVRG